MNKNTPQNIESRLASITAYLEDHKALDPFLIRFDSSNPVTDAVVIASATSRRHAQGLASGLLKALADAGQKFSHMEGFDAAQWILLDCNDIMIHIFQQDTRDLYRLDELCEQTRELSQENNL